jgi:S-adenosylmethionine synthetase
VSILGGHDGHRPRFRGEDQPAVQKVFSFKPANIIKQLDLLRPIYRSTTNYGHFGKPGLPWEQTQQDKGAPRRAK